MTMEFYTRIYCRKRSKFRGCFNGVCVLVLLFFFAYKDQILQNPFSGKPLFKTDFLENPISRREIYEKIADSSNYNGVESNRNPTVCTGIHQLHDHDSKCDYLRAHPECNSGGFFNYMMLFYCDCDKIEPLGYAVLSIWLIALLYLLGNTAADYFCCSLEMLSNLLKLSPTVAGVTLLPLGNGAPDVFASIAAFLGRDSGDVGLNSVLGGAVFVTCIVVGVVSLCVAERNIQIDKKCFVRDMVFFIVALLSLLIILVVGEVSVGGAVAFVSIYLVYAVCVAGTEILRKNGGRLKLEFMRPLLPVTDDEFDCIPLLESGDGVPFLQAKIPHWVWTSNVAVYSDEFVKTSGGESPKYLWGWNEEDTDSTSNQSSFSYCRMFCSLIEVPLAIPRRLTIPIVEERRWSKTYAVASAALAPVLIAFLWSYADTASNMAKEIVYLVGALVGCALGLLAFLYTTGDHPPRKFLFPWVVGGFLMSIVWFYIIANELVALLVALGVILQIKASLLGLTILAWGNSMGDLMSDVAIAMNGGSGVQVAMSGCYAGPMFNTLIGLGVSLLLGAWSKKPASYTVPEDGSLYLTLGFLILGLVWSLIVLPWSDMRPSKMLGIGLMIIYLGFLSFRASIAIGEG